MVFMRVEYARGTIAAQKYVVWDAPSGQAHPRSGRRERGVFQRRAGWWHW